MDSILQSGDRAPPFTLTDQAGKGVRLYSEATGQPVLLVFAVGPLETGIDPALSTLADAKVFILSDQDTGGAPSHGLECPVLSDGGGKIAAAYGATSGVTAFLLDCNLRIAEIVAPGSGLSPSRLAQAIADLTFPEPAPASRQAPVLLIPRVLDPDTCRSLIDHLEQDGGEEGNTVRVIDGDIVRAPNFEAKRRRDLSITDPGMIALLQGIVSRRVLQEIYRAFQIKMTYVEEFKLGCYEAENSGFFRVHRDNTTPATRHRQFAMTLNLNSEDYDGGELRFPEFGTGLFKPATGEAIIFSCTLMHEVLPMLRGRRYTLLSFFHDDAGEKTRNAYMREHGTG